MKFSSPNIAKPLHAGHLRSTLLGQFVSTIHERFQHRVHRLNYLGDWGTQYGRRQMAASSRNTLLFSYPGRLAVGFERFGSHEELRQHALKHLLDVSLGSAVQISRHSLS